MILCQGVPILEVFECFNAYLDEKTSISLSRYVAGTVKGGHRKRL